MTGFVSKKGKKSRYPSSRVGDTLSSGDQGSTKRDAAYC